MEDAINRKNREISSLHLQEQKLFEKALKVEGDKCDAYQNTIKKIVRILQDFLKNSGLILSHLSFPSNIGSIWKTIHYIHHKNKNPFKFQLFSTFGKGNTLEKAQASGFGELMERVQIGYMFSRNIFKLCLKPNGLEKIKSSHIILNNKFAEHLNKTNPFLPKKWEHKHIYVPYNHLNSNNRVPIESRFLIDSTGAASGNTYSEAFVQGLCEIFERFTAGYVLLNKINCPTISKKYLSKGNQEIIKKMEENDTEVIIKDLSLGSKKLPVIGVILKYPNIDNLPKREFKVASSPSLDIAFERTITETMQKAIDYKSRLLLAKRTLKFARNLYEYFPSLKKYLPFKIFVLMRFSHRSVYIDEEIEFLLKDHGTFIRWSYSNRDTTKELNNLKKICDNNAWNIYYKNYNWLNFPTLKLFCPELNFGFRTYTEYQTNQINHIKKQIIKKNFSFSNYKNFFKSPELLIYSWMNENVGSFLNIETNLLYGTSIWKLFGLLSLYNNEKELAIKFFKLIPNFSFRDFQIYRDEQKILKYLQRIIPDCSKPCSNCYYKNQCKYFYFKDIGQKAISVNSKFFSSSTFSCKELKHYA